MRSDEPASRTPSRHRRRRSLAGDDRGVSTAVGYVLALAITALLISGLLLAGGNFLDSERDRVARDQLGVLGERVAGGVESVDRLAGAGYGSPTAFVRLDLPSSAAGNQYRIAVDNTTTASMLAADRPYAYDLVLTVPTENLEVRIPIRTHHRLHDDRTVLGGDVVIVYRDEVGGADHELAILKEV